MERNEMRERKRNGMERNEMEWNARTEAEWNGMEWNGMRERKCGDYYICNIYTNQILIRI